MPGLTAAMAASLGVEDCVINLTSPRRRGANGDRSGQITAVSVQDAAKVQHHEVAGREDPVTRPMMRQRRVRARRDDRVEGQPLVSRVPHRRLDRHATTVRSVTPGRTADTAASTTGASRRAASRSVACSDRVLDDARLFDEARRRVELEPRVPRAPLAPASHS